MASTITSATMTQYDLQIMTRWVKIKAKDAMKDCDENEDGRISKHTGHFEVSYEVIWDDDDEKELWCWVYVLFDGKQNCIFKQKFVTAEAMMEDIISELKGKTYKVCKMPNCERLTMEDDQCEDCYIHDWYRGEECCVCKEDNGHWISMECGHLIHKACFNSMASHNWYHGSVKNNKCPLCRAPSSYTKEVNF